MFSVGGSGGGTIVELSRSPSGSTVPVKTGLKPGEQVVKDWIEGGRKKFAPADVYVVVESRRCKNAGNGDAGRDARVVVYEEDVAPEECRTAVRDQRARARLVAIATHRDRSRDRDEVGVSVRSVRLRRAGQRLRRRRRAGQRSERECGIVRAVVGREEAGVPYGSA